MHDKHPTLFEQRVYDALQYVPAGCVTTYGLLARHLGCRSAQAVGQALRRNPFAPAVPCHRVIAADLHIGGFTGQRGGAAIRRKQALLAQEGVTFDAQGRLEDTQRIFTFGRAATAGCFAAHRLWHRASAGSYSLSRE